VTVETFTLADTFVGAPGATTVPPPEASTGVTAAEATLSEPVPTLLTALTVKV
jgi:hypothetical protein